MRPYITLSQCIGVLVEKNGCKNKGVLEAHQPDHVYDIATKQYSRVADISLNGGNLCVDTRRDQRILNESYWNRWCTFQFEAPNSETLSMVLERDSQSPPGNRRVVYYLPLIWRGSATNTVLTQHTNPAPTMFLTAVLSGCSVPTKDPTNSEPNVVVIRTNGCKQLIKM